MENTILIISGAPSLADQDTLDESGLTAEVRSLSFSSVHHGVRLDRALVDLVPEFSRSYLQQLIELGAVSVNGHVVDKASNKVKVGDSGCIELRPTPQSQAFKAENLILDVVYQDAYLLIINKPAGMVVHPAPGNWSGTLMNGLLGLDARAFDLPRAGIVHRLDKDTSGLMVVARARPVMDALVQAIAARQIKRQYLALAQGPWQGQRTREIDAPVGRDPANRLRMAVVDLAMHSGKYARTDLDCLATCASGCLVKCSLHTGRTHQIRVHLASIGHPLVADLVYGGSLAGGMQRQALHATRLALQHPITRQMLDFSVPPPVDFLTAMTQWGLTYNPATF